MLWIVIMYTSFVLKLLYYIFQILYVCIYKHLSILKLLNHKALIINLLCINFAISQYHPPIQNFTPELYQAGNQNWKISQDDANRVYAANNFGLLEFNGSTWKLHATPNNTIMRSVFVYNNAIYTGAHMDFGYWLRQHDGQLKYTSLVKELNFNMIEDEQVWSIYSHKQFVIFQTLDRLIIYDQIKRDLSTLHPVSGILRVLADDNDIYYQDNNLSVYKIVNEKGVPFLSASELNNNHVIGVVTSSKGTLIITRDSGLFFKTNKLYPIKPSLSRELSRDVIFCFTKTKKGDLVLGSIKNGAYVLSSSGDLIQHIGINEGLLNATVLTVFSDAKEGIWLGLDNGLAYTSLSSPKQFYSLAQKPIGTVYVTETFNNILYVGTNQGLYYKRIDSSQPLTPISGLGGQVWSLQVIDNTLLCGHDKGAFRIDKGTATPLFSGSGIWLFKKLGDTKLLAGGYNGLHLLDNNTSSWRYNSQLQNFSISSRYFEVLNESEILVSHEYKGVFRLLLNKEKTEVLSTAQIPDIPTSLYSSMTTFQGDICYFSKGGFFKYDVSSNRFIKNNIISELFVDNNFTSAKMVVDRERFLWFFERNNLIRVEKGALSNEYIVNKFPLTYDMRKTNTGFENISHLDRDEYLIGTSDGFFVFDISKIQSLAPNIVLNGIVASSKDNKRQYVDMAEKIMLPANLNTVTADYFISNNNIAEKALYQFKLDGYSEKWTDWTEIASVTFSNLRFGSYTLSAKAMVGDIVSSQPYTIAFKIRRPWYFSTVALLSYALIMFGIFRVVNSRYSNYYRKEQQKLIEDNKRKLDLMELRQNEEIMRIKNQQLEDNIDQKNKELAISTMAMVKKNQFMNALLNDLEPAANDPTVSRVLRIIKRSLKNDDDWEFFEQAFDNADKDFLKRLKEEHPTLTNHDLKLCAYLRLNLSSKEIAPLLNISVKSVDIKRYRLRKKISLEHNQNLTDYILSL